jgi:hypothetical protein
LVGKKVDLAASSDTNVVVQNAKNHETTLAFPFYYFAGSGLIYDSQKHPEWKTYQYYLEENSNKEAIVKTFEQIKGARIGVSKGSSQYITLVELLNYANISVDNYEIIDIEVENLPPLLFSDSIDIMISGIPQRLVAKKQGYNTLIDQSVLPSSVVHAGFATHRTWVKENVDLSYRFQKVLFKTIRYIEENPDESFRIIAEKLKESGTIVDEDDLKEVWNNMEFYIPTKEEYISDVIVEDGRFYWEDRFKAVVNNVKETENIQSIPVSLDDLYYGKLIVTGEI